MTMTELNALKSLSPELFNEAMKAISATTLTSKSIHFVGDNTVTILRKTADAIETFTNNSAHKGGVAQLYAAPAAKAGIDMVYNCCGRVVTGFATGAKAGYKAALAPKLAVVCFE